MRGGPYAIVRRPIDPPLLAPIGTALYLDEWRGPPVLPCFFAGFWWEARGEEALLQAECGAAYSSYRVRMGRPLPRFRRA